MKEDCDFQLSQIKDVIEMEDTKEAKLSAIIFVLCQEDEERYNKIVSMVTTYPLFTDFDIMIDGILSMSVDGRKKIQLIINFLSGEDETLMEIRYNKIQEILYN